MENGINKNMLHLKCIAGIQNFNAINNLIRISFQIYIIYKLKIGIKPLGST